MTKLKKLTTLLLTLALVITLVPMTADAAGISKRKVSLYVGQTTTLKAGAKAKWRSGNKSIATVSKKGVVRAKKAGKTTITAKAGKKTYRCTVTVKNTRINYKSMELDQGETETIKATGASIKQCHSGNTKVATVTRKGVVRGVSKGSTTITVTLSNYMKYSIPVTVYGDDNDVAVQNDNPTATKNPSCSHYFDYSKPIKKWGVPAEKENMHDMYALFKCSLCGEEVEKLTGTGHPCIGSETQKDDPYSRLEYCTLDEINLKTVKEPNCKEDGKRYPFCVWCGRQMKNMYTVGTWSPTQGYGSMSDEAWENLTTIPRLNHDLEYEYKREISVQPGWTTRNYPEASRNVIENDFGERTATCKRCGESFEEVGIDTGTELNDGSREIVWGVWKQDKNEEILKEINAYRSGVDAIKREPLEASETLNRAAVYILAEKLQMWTNYGDPGAIRALGQFDGHSRLRENLSGRFPIKNCYDLRGANDEYPISEFTSGSLMDTQFRFSQDIKYAGVAYFSIEASNGSFYDGVFATAKEDEVLDYSCYHAAGYEFGAVGGCTESGTRNCPKCQFVWPPVEVFE